MTIFESLKSIPHLSAVSRVIMAVPLPVAASRPSEPPSSNGLPVTIAGEYPCIWLYSSMNQLITCAFVFTSGAGISTFTPIMGSMARKNLLDILSNSVLLYFDGSTPIPPLPPP